MIERMVDMAKLKVGIIGCGGIANGKHMPALAKQADRAEMVAFCDIIEERAQKAAQNYGVAGARFISTTGGCLRTRALMWCTSALPTEATLRLR